MNTPKKKSSEFSWGKWLFQPAIIAVLVNSTGCASAKDNVTPIEICSSVATRYSVVKTSDEIKILSFITNYSNKEIEFVPDEFSSDLSITAELIGSSDEIKVVIPMAGLPMPINLQKQETYEGELLLNTVIPNLHNMLKLHSIKISWDNSFDPENTCFSSDNKHSVILKKIE